MELRSRREPPLATLVADTYGLNFDLKDAMHILGCLSNWNDEMDSGYEIIRPEMESVLERIAEMEKEVKEEKKFRKEIITDLNKLMKLYKHALPLKQKILHLEKTILEKYERWHH